MTPRPTQFAASGVSVAPTVSGYRGGWGLPKSRPMSSLLNSPAGKAAGAFSGAARFSYCQPSSAANAPANFPRGVLPVTRAFIPQSSAVGSPSQSAGVTQSRIGFDMAAPQAPAGQTQASGGQ